MRHTLTLATACLNTTPLDIDGNLDLIGQAITAAWQQQADLLLLPELAITGYGCEDMFFASDWLEEMPDHLLAVAAMVPPSMLVACGVPLLVNGGQLFNCVALLARNRVLGVVAKQHLARNGIHYEPRWFTPWLAGEQSELTIGEQRVPFGDLVIDVDGVRIGFEICEDSWVASRPGRSLYQRQVDLILNPSASHFALGKHPIRCQFVCEGSRAFGVAYGYANLLGCEAGRAIFDGGALIASNGELVMSGRRLSFEALVVESATIDLQLNRAQRLISSQPLRPGAGDGVVSVDFRWAAEALQRPLSPQLAAPVDDQQRDACLAIALGLWDWQRKTATAGFAISLSGGADSALCASLVYLAQQQALRTLGATAYRQQLVRCGVVVDEALDGEPLLQAAMAALLTTLYQGSALSGSVTRSAAATLAAAIGASHHDWSIAELVDGYVGRANALTPTRPLNWQQDDLALQNIQARVRAPGIWLLANREGKLLIATSNLSEASVGYCTMDGDTAGVLSPIGGVSKSRVLQLLRYLLDEGVELVDGQRLRLPALAAVVNQQPTAELRPGAQTDESDLMPFVVLDRIRRIAQTQHLGPKGILKVLVREPLAEQYGVDQLCQWLRRYFELYCRNQWKRERLAVGFHIEADSADPKSYRRFPVLSSQLKRELAAMESWAAQLNPS